MNATAPTALITGASRGIGLGIAKALAGRGYALTIASRDAVALDTVADLLRAAGARAVLAVPADAADASAMIETARRHEEAYGALSALVLAAGVGSAGELAGYSLKRWDKQFAVNVRSAFVLVNRLLPLMRKTAAQRPEGIARLVALASIEALYPEPGLGAYGASKAALVSLCHSVNAEESGRGVAATAISPAYVNTDMSAWVHDEVPPEAMIQVSDVVEMVDTVLHLSARAIVPHVVMTRPGNGYSA